MEENLRRHLLRGFALPLLLISGVVGHSLWVGDPLSKLFPSRSWTRLLFPFRETVELVVDLPDVPQLIIPNLGRHVDLGYLHTAEGGKWVARVDRKQYFELTPYLRDTMLQIGRMRELPPIPATPWTCYLSKPAVAFLSLLVAGLIFLVSKLIAPFVKPPKDESTFLPEEKFQAFITAHNRNASHNGPASFGKRNH
jgi:hypothetical protein